MMTRRQKFMIGVGVLLLWSRAFTPTTVIADEPRLHVVYQASRLSVEAQDVPLLQVLREIGKGAGFPVVNIGGPYPALTASIKDVPLVEALRQLLRAANYVIVSRQAGEATETTIDKLYLLGPEAHATVTARVTDVETQRSRRHHLKLRDEHQKADPQAMLDREPNEEDIHGRVADLLRVQALVGMEDTPQMPQESPAHIEEALAITTRVAQQNLRALIDGLTTVTNALLDAQAQEQAQK
jgi:hypothetical protein